MYNDKTRIHGRPSFLFLLLSRDGPPLSPQCRDHYVIPADLCKINIWVFRGKSYLSIFLEYCYFHLPQMLTSQSCSLHRPTFSQKISIYLYKFFKITPHSNTSTFKYFNLLPIKILKISAAQLHFPQRPHLLFPHGPSSLLNWRIQATSIDVMRLDSFFLAGLTPSSLRTRQLLALVWDF